MKKKQKKKKKYRVFWFFVKLQIFLMVLVIGAVGFYYFGGYGAKVSSLRNEARQIAKDSTEDNFRSVQTSVVYDAGKSPISTLKGEKDVYYLEIDAIPVYVKAAIVSIEDKKFYQHNGIDIKAILRAAKAMLQNGEVTQGGSTITQQLARNIYLTQERTWQRKVEEIFLAVELEKYYSKDQILEFYLNNIYFGNGYYGIQAASRGYFNQDVNELNLSQMAFLCAIPNNPTLYDPVDKMDNTIKRRDRILENMKEDGKITDVTCQEAIGTAIVLERPQKKKNDYVETYAYYCATRALMEMQGFVFQTEFKAESEREVYDERYGEMYSQCQQSLYQKGYRIYTSLNLDVQSKLQQAVDDTLAEYTEVNEEGVYTLQSSAVCIDNHTGFVTAIVGGRGQEMAGYTLNRAYQSFRQPGSAVKPLIVYTPILERGYTPDSTVVDEEIEDGPKNADGVFEGEMSLRNAVKRSRNTVAWRLLEEITPEVGLSYLEKMNFTKLRPEDEQPAAALGGFTTGASALEMTSGYAAIENDGKYRRPTCIVSITDADGNELYVSSMEGEQVYQENAARMMTDIMKDVVEEGTGRGLGVSTMPSAGKTGTTNDNKDGWFVGYTQYFTTGVWVGYDMPQELPGLSGGSYPGSIWKTFMESVHEGLEPQEFLPYVGMETENTEPEEPVEEEPEELQDTPPQETPPQITPPQDTGSQPPQEGTQPDGGNQTGGTNGDQGGNSNGGSQPGDQGGSQPGGDQTGGSNGDQNGNQGGDGGSTGGTDSGNQGDAAGGEGSGNQGGTNGGNTGGDNQPGGDQTPPGGQNPGNGSQPGDGQGNGDGTTEPPDEDYSDKDIM